MSAPICFLDTETTGLHPGRRAWEVAIIRRDTDGEHTFHAFVEDIDVSEADLRGLRVGRFHDRHPLHNVELARVLKRDGDPFDPWWRHGRVEEGALLLPEIEVAVVVERMTRGAHLVGAVPNFDAEVLADLLRRNYRIPAWHYHLIDVETLAVGYLHGLAMYEDSRGHASAVTLPWDSDALSRAVGAAPACDEERHTALGDARWAMRVYDAVNGHRGEVPDTQPPPG